MFKFTYQKCLICFGDKFHIVRSWQTKDIKFDVTICKNCGFVSQNPKPLKNDKEMFLRIMGNDRYQNNTLNEIDDKCRNKAWHIYDFINSELKFLINKRRIRDSKNNVYNLLDIGCATGGTLFELSKIIELTNEVIICGQGIESYKNYYEYAQMKYNNSLNQLSLNYNLSIKPQFRNYDLENLSKIFWTDFSNDITIMSHVLEHFIDPKRILLKLRQSLNNDSIVYIEVPSFHYGLKKHTIGMKNPLIQIPEHFSFFTKTSLSNLLNKCGFDIKKLEEDKKYCNIKCIVRMRKTYYEDYYKKENWKWSLFKHYVHRFM